MKIPFILNSESVIAEAEPGERLLSILRNRFRLAGTKEGCIAGRCGSCMVLLDGSPVSSCLIPISIIKDCEIVTLEYFSQTPEYADITNGFRQTGIELCGFCNAGKIFTAHEILSKNLRPTKEEVREQLTGNDCTCVNTEQLIAGIRLAGALKRKRLDEN
ncbi:MAG: 2Fe-2S iron-sulfur cluster binding domain-containing protein [Spirochaetaceae bacterium]|jgi:carbon-monoxide dehydrogenase small subunit|nr:2Fe-2S iron-sulfur cluster binding domain-containing protein [Spirochaetaceae bacterium]